MAVSPLLSPLHKNVHTPCHSVVEWCVVAAAEAGRKKKKKKKKKEGRPAANEFSGLWMANSYDSPLT